MKVSLVSRVFKRAVFVSFCGFRPLLSSLAGEYSSEKFSLFPKTKAMINCKTYILNSE